MPRAPDPPGDRGEGRLPARPTVTREYAASSGSTGPPTYQDGGPHSPFVVASTAPHSGLSSPSGDREPAEGQRIAPRAGGKRARGVTGRPRDFLQQAAGAGLPERKGRARRLRGPWRSAAGFNAAAGGRRETGDDSAAGPREAGLGRPPRATVGRRWRGESGSRGGPAGEGADRGGWSSRTGRERVRGNSGRNSRRQGMRAGEQGLGGGGTPQRVWRGRGAP